jgi:hypothetical protein
MSTEPGSDPVGDFQRWLMRTGAKSIGRDVASRVKSTIGGGGGGAKQGDVWETATTEEPTDEPPECQWCPICRAARRYRDTGSTATLGGQFAGVGDTLAGLTRDAFGLFDAAMKASQRPADAPRGPSGTAGSTAGGTTGSTAGRPADKPAGQPDDRQAAQPDSDHGTVVVGPGIGWPTVVHAEHQDDEPADERGDRQEGGEPGDGGADGGTDEQVERTAE